MQITNFRDINKGRMFASFDVTIEALGMTLRKLLLFSKDGRRWVSFPSQKYSLKDGTDGYYAYIFMEKSKKEKFDQAIIELLDKGEYRKAEAKEEDLPF